MRPYHGRDPLIRPFQRSGRGVHADDEDFVSWSDSSVVSFGGLTGTGRYSSECPHAVHRHGRFYLFRTQQYGPRNITIVYYSTDPAMFGINQDRRYLATRLAVAAPEVMPYDARDYIAALNLNLDGLRIARLEWRAAPAADNRALEVNPTGGGGSPGSVRPR